MTNSERVMRAIHRKGESEDFKGYAQNLLGYFPEMTLPVIRYYYKYHATPSEIRAADGIKYSI